VPILSLAIEGETSLVCATGANASPAVPPVFRCSWVPTVALKVYLPCVCHWSQCLPWCAACVQVFLGPNGGTDTEGNTLPRMVYVSREKRPGYNHHKKAGAMNCLVSHAACHRVTLPALIHKGSHRG